MLQLDHVISNILNQPSSEVELQALATDLVKRARAEDPNFNALLRDRWRLVKTNIVRATLQDFVLILSAIGLRLS